MMKSSRKSRRRQLSNGGIEQKAVCQTAPSLTPRVEPRLRKSSSTVSPNCECRTNILAAYEKVLESHTTPLNRASVLPFSKEAIREAIREELAENPLNEHRNHLELAFVQLESFVPIDEYELVEDFKQLSRTAQKMARSGNPRDIMESWALVKQASGDEAVRIFEAISEKMRRRLDEIRKTGSS
jgi:hypothetical protein